MAEPDAHTESEPLDLDLLNEAAEEHQRGQQLAYASVQIAGICSVDYRIVNGEVVDLFASDGPAGNTRIALRGPVAELKLIVALMGRALDRANREMGHPTTGIEIP